MPAERPAVRALDGRGLSVAIVWSRFNEEITGELRRGAEATLVESGVVPGAVATFDVPGAFEIPLVARRLAASGEFDAVIALGAVIRGETAHFELVANEAAAGIARAGYETGVPVIFGVVATENHEQARARAGGELGNRGEDAARAAVEMARLVRELDARRAQAPVPGVPREPGAVSAGAPTPSERARGAMVEALVSSGTLRDARIVAALEAVARERFVPCFWTSSPTPDDGPEEIREWLSGEDFESLALVYDVERALAIREPRSSGGGDVDLATSTISAPRVVAAMLEQLDLDRGMRVLEIGLGSGYNAALLRELVEPEGEVTSIDIDADLVARTGRLLCDAGYFDLALVAADGYLGRAERAPFDRIVATVGCADLAPAWVAQLAPGGFCLLPLEHGDADPLLRVAPDPKGRGRAARDGGDRAAGGLDGRFVGYAAFIAMRGVQGGTAPWSRAGRSRALPPMSWSDLPAGTSRALHNAEGRRRGFDLAFFLALEDRRASRLGLVDGASEAVIGERGGRIGSRGPDGAALGERLSALIERFLALGRPHLFDYRVRFMAREDGPVPTAGGERWVVERLDYREIVELPGR